MTDIKLFEVGYYDTKFGHRSMPNILNSDSYIDIHDIKELQGQEYEVLCYEVIDVDLYGETCTQRIFIKINNEIYAFDYRESIDDECEYIGTHKVSNFQPLKYDLE